MKKNNFPLINLNSGTHNLFENYVYDTFTTDRTAGTVDGTNAEPGPGVRGVVDTTNKLSLSGGAAVFATGGAANDPALRITPSLSRVAGRIAKVALVYSASGIDVGWDANLTFSPSDSIRFNGTSLQIRLNNTTVVVVGSCAVDTEYICVVAMRVAGGAFYFVKETSGSWQFLFSSDLGVHTEAYPCANALTATTVATVYYMRVPALRWLPSPLISDGFSVQGVSDGLGHAEGIAGGLGSGGDGVSWTDEFGTWAGGGVAYASALASGRAIRTAFVSTPDVMITAKCTLVSGTMSIIVRWASESDFVQLRLTSTNRQLVKVVSGVATTVSDTAYTYVAGAELRLICQGSAFRTFYNNAAIGGEFTISDAALQSPTEVGLRTDNVGNQFDDFIVYARGTSGEYGAVLDAI